MRRVWGLVAFVVGIMLIALAPLLRLYVLPRVQKAPTNVYEKVISRGSGEIFSASSLSVVGPVPLENIAINKGDVARSTRDVIVITVFTRTISSNPQVGDVDYSMDTYAMNRSTGYAVHCCGESPRHTGVTLKFPFGTSKSAVYPFYDSTAHKAFPAKYVRTEKVDGMSTYVFASTVPQTFLENMEVPGSLANLPDQPSIPVERWYRATTTVWVEPTTGGVVKAGQVASQWITYNGQFVSTLASTDLVNDPPSVQMLVNEVKGQLGKLRLVQVWLPIFAPIVGLILLALGLFLVLAGRAETTSEPVTAGAQTVVAT